MCAKWTRVNDIRERVLASIELVERGEYSEYEGAVGLKKLADEVKATGRKRLLREKSLEGRAATARKGAGQGDL